MEDTLTIIQKEEEVSEKRINEVQARIEEERKERTVFWEKEEKKLKEEYSSRKANLEKEIEGELNKIRKDFEDKLLEEISQVEKASEKNQAAFASEVERAILEFQ